MSPRAYTQTARAEATAATRRSVLDAAQALFEESDGTADLTLDQVAERAAVSTRTVLRHFASREGLVEAAVVDAEARVASSRRAPSGDPPAAIAVLVDHYEELGDRVMRRLAEADRYPLLRRVTERGARMHADWVSEVFAADLAGLPRAERRRRAAQLASVTDVYMWALLRRRHGLSRKETEASILRLVEATRGASR